METASKQFYDQVEDGEEALEEVRYHRDVGNEGWADILQQRLQHYTLYQLHDLRKEAMQEVLQILELEKKAKTDGK